MVIANRGYEERGITHVGKVKDGEEWITGSGDAWHLEDSWQSMSFSLGSGSTNGGVYWAKCLPGLLSVYWDNRGYPAHSKDYFLNGNDCDFALTTVIDRTARAP